MAFWGRVLLGVVVRITVSVSIVLAGMALYHAFATWQEDNYFAPPGTPLSLSLQALLHASSSSSSSTSSSSLLVALCTPGSMIDVDGHFIHLHCFGGRSPHGDGGDEGDDDDDDGNVRCSTVLLRPSRVSCG